jgi:hypothetical protein
MALSPYPVNGKPYRDRWECPCIYFSQDGLHWQENTNPIDNLTEDEISRREFFSDPDLVITSNRLECWYRITRKTSNNMDTYILRKCSEDGMNWSEREVLINPTDTNTIDTLGDMVRSQSVIYDKIYRMWYVDNTSNCRNVCYTKSHDGKIWLKRVVCTLHGHKVNPWHINLVMIDGEYLLTIYGDKDLTLWKGSDGIHFSYLKTLLKPSLVYGSFYSDGLYRSSMIKVDNRYMVYFSAYDEKRTYIGLMRGTSLESMKVIDVMDSHRTYNYLRVYWENRRRFMSRIKHLIKH